MISGSSVRHVSMFFDSASHVTCVFSKSADAPSEPPMKSISSAS
jgi:hypothetical protein